MPALLLWVLPESVLKDEKDTRRNQPGHLGPFATPFPTHSFPFAEVQASGTRTVPLGLLLYFLLSFS